MRAKLIVAALLYCGLVAAAVLSGAPSIPTDDRAIVHALNRLGFGPRPGDVARVKAMGLATWIDRQLAPDRVEDGALESRLARLTTLRLDSRRIVQEYDRPATEERRRLPRAGADPASGDPRQTPREPDARVPLTDAQRRNRQVVADLEEGKLLRAVYSERQLEEVLVDFWFNHFNVFAGKGPTRDYVGAYERDAIRPHVLGRFRDLLEATARSPAMLFYLDNWENVDPNAPRMTDRVLNDPMRGMRPLRPGARFPQRGANPAAARPQRGLNENYARELMELHTLGVDGGYTQADVVEVARAFTGWTMRPREGTGFVFGPALHDTGTKTVLRHTIRAGGGVEDGEQVLDILAAHPNTARHVATKLAQRFVSDAPPQALVDRAARRFLETKGDLREVTRAIITSPEFFDRDAYRAKVKTPLEFVASALRAVGADVRVALPVARTLRELGMPLYFCQPPTGYDDSAEPWVSSGALVTRMNFALELGANRLRGVVSSIGAGASVDAVRDDLIATALSRDVSPGTRATLAKASTVDQVVALAIGSPEFQRQ
jgi:uncharacterized protein (DUF1800 family)